MEHSSIFASLEDEKKTKNDYKSNGDFDCDDLEEIYSKADFTHSFELSQETTLFSLKDSDGGVAKKASEELVAIVDMPYFRVPTLTKEYLSVHEVKVGVEHILTQLAQRDSMVIMLGVWEQDIYRVKKVFMHPFMLRYGGYRFMLSDEKLDVLLKEALHTKELTAITASHENPIFYAEEELKILFNVRGEKLPTGIRNWARTTFEQMRLLSGSEKGHAMNALRIMGPVGYYHFVYGAHCRQRKE